MAAQIEAYGIAIEAHDIRDIEAAVRRFIRGEVEGHNQSFPPTAAKLGAVVRLCMNDRLDAERRRAPPKLLPPDVEHSPESRARVAAKVAELVARNAALMRTEDAEGDRRRKELADRTNARFKPDMSPEAARKRLGFTAGDPDGDRQIA